MTVAERTRANAALGSLSAAVCVRALVDPAPLTGIYMAFGSRVGTGAGLERGITHPIFEKSLRISGVWRLDREDAVLCSWDDDRSPGGRLRLAVASLASHRVTRVTFSAPAGDLTLGFDHGELLQVFCSVKEGACGGDYTFTDRTPRQEVSFDVGPLGAVVFHGS